jgi:UDP-glucose 4-epimerase
VKKNNIKKHILVIGGTGFIGYHVLKKAKKLNWKLTSVSVHEPRASRYIKGVKYLKLNIKSKKEIEKKLNSNFSYIINLAGQSSEVFSTLKKKKLYDTQMSGSKNLMNFFLDKKIEKFIQIGSAAEYGSINLPHNENNKCLPKSDYGKTKLRATKYLLKLCKKNSFPGIVIRLFQVYGATQDQDKIIPYILKNCVNNKSFGLSIGVQKRDFCFIDDVIQAIFILLKKNKINGEVFNVSLGQSISIKNLTRLIQKKTGKGKPIFGNIRLKKNEIIKSQACIKKIRKKTGWYPKINLNKGLTLMLKSI